MREKCQKCAKPATYHITDLDKGKPRSTRVPFCDEHGGSTSPAEESSEAADGKMAEGDQGRGRAREGSPRQQCAVCQNHFLAFPNTGRLGCPHV